MSKIPVERLLKALIRGCHATSASVVNVHTSQVIDILGWDTVYNNNVFNWTVDTEHAQQIKRRPNSVIPEHAYTTTVGMSEANREILLDLLCEHKNRYYPDLVITDERNRVIDRVAPRPTPREIRAGRVPISPPNTEVDK